jgi:hypothetical protein
MTVGTVVWRRSNSCGSTQTDSRIIEKAQNTWGDQQLATLCGAIRLTNLQNPVRRMRFEKKYHKGGSHGRSGNRQQGKFPRLFIFPGPRECSRHQKEYIKRWQDVEKFKKYQVPIRPLACFDEIQVSCYKNNGIEQLCEERYACITRGPSAPNLAPSSNFPSCVYSVTSIWHVIGGEETYPPNFGCGESPRLECTWRKCAKGPPGCGKYSNSCLRATSSNQRSKFLVKRQYSAMVSKRSTVMLFSIYANSAIDLGRLWTSQMVLRFVW